MTRAPERTLVIVLGGLSALVIAGGVLLSVFDGNTPRAPRPDVAAATVAPVAPAPKAPTMAPPQASVVTSASPKAPAVVWPEPLPIPGVRAVSNPSFGDPFDGEGGGPKDVRVLATVGAFRLGVTNDSKVRDEATVTAVLKELGAEIDAQDKGRSESYERRVMEYQSTFDRYRAKLKPAMDGSFAVKGNGWSDTELVVVPARAGASAGHAH